MGGTRTGIGISFGGKADLSLISSLSLLKNIFVAYSIFVLLFYCFVLLEGIKLNYVSVFSRLNAWVLEFGACTWSPRNQR